MAYSLYKARGMPQKQSPCAICIDRTRGRTRQLKLGYGVAIWLCPDHASVEFLTKRSGRDFVRTMSGVWEANGCLTTSRNKALMAHLTALKPRPRRRPGSYAWPRVRLEAERLYALGEPTSNVHRRLRTAGYGVCERPSLRTLQRWRAEQRHLARDGPIRIV